MVNPQQFIDFPSLYYRL